MPEDTETETVTTETTTTETEEQLTETVTQTPEELKAEVEKYKALARKQEDRAKANAKAAKDLEVLQQNAMSDQEKAVAEAEARGRTSATTEVASRLADAEIRVALTGVVPDPAAIVEDLNLSRYITEGGEVDTDAVAKLADKYKALAGTKPGTPGVPAGARDEKKPTRDEQLAAAAASGDNRAFIALQNTRLAEMGSPQQ